MKKILNGSQVNICTEDDVNIIKHSKTSVTAIPNVYETKIKIDLKPGQQLNQNNK